MAINTKAYIIIAKYLPIIIWVFVIGEENKSFIDAEKIMLDVHKKGRGVAGIYSYDIAITKVATAMSMAKSEGFPFKLTTEEV